MSRKRSRHGIQKGGDGRDNVTYQSKPTFSAIWLYDSDTCLTFTYLCSPGKAFSTFRHRPVFQPSLPLALVRLLPFACLGDPIRSVRWGFTSRHQQIPSRAILCVSLNNQELGSSAFCPISCLLSLLSSPAHRQPSAARLRLVLWMLEISGNVGVQRK